MLNTNSVLLTERDIKSSVKLPKELTPELSYFIGLLVGDGYIKYQVKSYHYRICIDGNKNELDWYLNYLKLLVNKLFNKIPSIYLTQTTVQLAIHSRAIFFFLTKVCGLIESPKTHCRIPEIIRSSSKEIKCAFLRGLADTDGSFVLKRKEGKLYPVIDFSTCSKELQADLVQMLSELRIQSCSGVYHTTRRETPITRYYVQINGKARTERWMELIGFYSPTQINRYKKWKRP